MFVYRIQNKYGHGPYNPHKLSKRKSNNSPYFSNKLLEAIDNLARLDDGFRFPPQQSDKLSRQELARFKKGHYMSAFASLKQLVAWFPIEEELKMLKKYGFDIYKVEAAKIIKLENQVIFIPKCEVGECSKKITNSDLKKLSKKEMDDISNIIKSRKRKLRKSLKYETLIPVIIKNKIASLIKE